MVDKIIKQKTRKIKNKKGQMKIQQTAFVLVAVTLFFVLVGMFFLNIKLSQMEESASILREREAEELVSKLANSPEFSCGSSFQGEIKGACVDFDKVMALKKNIESYKSMWGVEGIELARVFPKNNSEKTIECNQDNYPDCDKITLLESEKTGKENYVSLCRKKDLGYRTKSKCEIGKLIVKYEKIS